MLLYIGARRQRIFCVTSSIKMKSQAASSRAFVNYSKLLLLKYTTNSIQSVKTQFP
jgi:hypothetical protein